MNQDRQLVSTTMFTACNLQTPRVPQQSDIPNNVDVLTVNQYAVIARRSVMAFSNGSKRKVELLERYPAWMYLKVSKKRYRRSSSNILTTVTAWSHLLIRTVIKVVVMQTLPSPLRIFQLRSTCIMVSSRVVHIHSIHALTFAFSSEQIGHCDGYSSMHRIWHLGDAC